MAVTPKDIALLALARHRRPWNWTFQACGFGLFCLALLLHSPLIVAAAFICMGAGFFEWGLPEPDNRWFRFVAAAVEWEKNWAAAPWNRHKWWRFLFVLTALAVLFWALWVGEAMALGLFLGFTALARVAWENRDGGIDL